MVAWSQDQQDLREAVSCLQKELSASHIEDDVRAQFPREKWDLIAASGLLGLHFEEEYGGLGQDLLTTMYALEALGQSCRDAGLIFSVTTTMCSVGVPFTRYGSPELKERYLPGICSGELIGAHAITEPSGGSDALSMMTRAEKQDDDSFVLNGSKCFVSNGPIADVITVYAKTHPSGGPLGITAFAVDRDTPGLEIGKPMSKMGLRTSPLCELFFDDVRLPRSQVVGKVGMGYRILDFVMKREVLFSYIGNVGEMQDRLDRTIEYARGREAFGASISTYQHVQRRIVDMLVRVETGRKWLYDTGEKLQAGEDVTTDLAISKLLVSEGNVASSLDAIQVFGGNGYMTEFGEEKDLRNAVAGTIYSGTTEIQYNRIASMLGL